MQTVIPVEVREDEVLVITFDSQLTDEGIRRIKNAWDEAMSNKASAVIIDGNPSLHVVKRAGEANA